MSQELLGREARGLHVRPGVARGQRLPVRVGSPNVGVGVDDLHCFALRAAAQNRSARSPRCPAAVPRVYPGAWGGVLAYLGSSNLFLPDRPISWNLGGCRASITMTANTA